MRTVGRNRDATTLAPEQVGDVAACLDLLAVCLRTGACELDALESVAQVSGPVVCEHLRRVAVAQRWGLDVDEAWALAPDVWAPARQAMALAAGTGAAPADLLRQAAASIRRDQRTRAEASAARLAVWLVVPLGLCFLPAFFLITVVPTVIALGRDLLAH